MIKKIESLRLSFDNALIESTTSSQIKELRTTFLGRKGHIPALMKFLKDTGLEYKLREKQETGHALYGKRIVLSGFRSGDLKAALENVGAKMGSSVTKDTFVLLAKTMGSSKVKEAERYGIPVMEPAEFVKEYL